MINEAETPLIDLITIFITLSCRLVPSLHLSSVPLGSTPPIPVLSLGNLLMQCSESVHVQHALALTPVLHSYLPQVPQWLGAGTYEAFLLV
jgi:hypothetical protein